MSPGATDTLLLLPFAAPAEIDDAGVLAEMLAETGRGRGPGLHLGGQINSAIALDQERPLPLWSLLGTEGEEFVTRVYEELLGRPPDLAAMTHYEAGLAAGTVSKVEVVGAVRYSTEGRKVNRKVTGLLPRYLLRRAYHVPVLGRLVRMAVAVVRLPRLAAELQQVTRMLADTQARLNHLERQGDNGSALLARVQQVEARLGTLETNRYVRYKE